MDLKRILTIGPFRQKLLVLLLAIFLPACAIIVVSGLNHRQDEIVKAQNKALLVAQSLAAQQEHISFTTKAILSTLAQSPEVQRLDAPACSRIFRELQQRYPFFLIICASTPDGNMFAASLPFEAGKVNLANRKHIQDAIKTRDFSAGEYLIGRVAKVASCKYAFPVLDANKKLIAVLGAGFDPNEFARFIEKAGKLPEGSSVGLLDHQGVRLHRWPKNEATVLGEPVPSDFFEQISAGREEGCLDWVGQDGIQRIYAFKHLRLREDSAPYMYISVGLPKDKILQAANRKMWGDLALLGVAALLALALLWILGDQLFIKPINWLVSAVYRFGNGALDSRTGLPHTPDELGRLAQSFDNMAGLLEKKNLERQQAELALQQAHDELEQRVIERTAELNQTVEELRLEIESHLATQEILLESEERFRSLVENIDLGISLIGSDYRIIMSNPAQGDLFLKQTSELIGKECFREFEKRETVCPHCPGSVAMATGKKAEAETQGGREDGSNFTVRIQAFPRFGPDGQITGFIEVLEDITQRKRVEKALETERLILRDILEVTLAGYWDWDIANKQEYLSPTFKKMFGYGDHELANSPETWKSLIFPEDLPGVRDIFRKHVKSRGAVPYYNEVRYRHKDGSTIWVICAGRVIEWNATGKPLRMVGCHVDITERKRAEEALRQAHETLRATLDAAPVGILDLDTEGRVKSLWNPAAEQMLGWRRGEVLGHYLPSVPEENTEEFARFREWVRSGKPIMGKDVKRRRKDGSLIEYSIFAAPEYDDHGEVIGNIAVLVDITERKRAEEVIKLNEARLAGLLRISQYQAESIQDLLNYALEEAIALTASKIGFIYFYDDTAQQFTLNAWSKGVMRECSIAEYQLEQTGIWEEAVRQARPILVNDFFAPYPLKKWYTAGHALQKFLIIPVFANKRIVAVVGVANKAADYDEADVLQLTLMMDAIWKIVERRQAEEGLQAAAHKWRTTFDAITDAVFLMDPEGTILQGNQGLADLVGRPFADILGRRCHEVIHGTSHRMPDCPLTRMRETRQREESLLPMGGRWYKVGIDPILDEAGNLTGAVHIISDVTQLTETERSLYSRTQDLMMMNSIGAIVSRSLDLHKVLDGSLRMIQQNMFDGQSRAIVFLLDEATGELKAAGHRGVPEDHPCLGRPLRVGKCLCGRAALNGEMVVSRQGCADCATGFLAPDSVPLQDIGLPLKVRDRLLGVMHLSLSPDQTVDERHLKLLEAIADQISLAVEKARLFEKVNLQGTQLRNLSARLAEIEEAERKVLARELHDQVGQSLTTLSLCLTMLQEQLPRMIPEKVESRLTDALTLVEETADSVREIMAELRPPVLDDFGLLAAARWFGKQFSQRTGISLQATGEDPEPRLDRKVEMGVFRIVQEALNNVAKHARASRVTVTEEVLNGRVRLTIADNGIGFDVSQVGHPEGRHRWGLMNMSERALAAGGTCRIDSQPGQGTKVIVEVQR